MKQQTIFDDQPTHSWTVYIDGASRNNPGKAGAGIFIQKDGEVVCKEGFYLGIKTNNQAEYYALLLGLFLLQQYAQKNDTIRLASDSELLVKQIKGAYRVKNEGLKPLHICAQKMIVQLPIEIMHVMRSDNVQADKLANQGIDSKNPLPDSFMALLKDHGITVD